jgi:aspartate aminotransferase-like enzyme
MAGAHAPLHHRGPDFAALMQRLQPLLQMVFCTTQPVLILGSSGTGAAEAAISNICAPGDKGIVINNGRFAARWGTMMRSFGVQTVEIPVEWGDAVQPEQLRQTLQEHPDARCVWVVHTETSTGVRTDISRLGAVTREHSDALLCVDAITSLGAEECRMDDWGIDVVVGASQKALMTPPGLAVLALSERAWQRTESVTPPGLYFNLRETRDRLMRRTTVWTPPVTLFAALEQALRMIANEGMEHVWRRHALLGAAFRDGVQALKLDIFAQYPSDAVTVAFLPEAGEQFRTHLLSAYKVRTAAGQDHLKGKVFRLSHMGYCDEGDILALLSAMERALADTGHSVQPGAGVFAAQQRFVAGR